MTIDNDALARRIATAVATKSGFRPGPVLRKRLANQGKLGKDQEFHCHETLVEAILTVLREALPTSETCEWTECDGFEMGVVCRWGTACGESFLLDDGGPRDSRMAYCCYCGKKLVEVPFNEPE